MVIDAPPRLPPRTTALCDVVGIAIAVRAWRATTGASTAQPYTDDAVRALLCLLSVAAVEVVAGLATVPAALSAGGPSHAWSTGVVPSRYAVAVGASAAAVLLWLAAAVVVLRDYAKRGSVSGVPTGATASVRDAPTSPVGTLLRTLTGLVPLPVNLAIGSSSSVVHNGVVVPRAARPLSSLVSPGAPEGRRLGTV